MSQTQVFEEGKFSIGIATQSDLNTEATVTVFLDDVREVSWTHDTAQTDMANASRSARADNVAPFPGRELVRLTTKFSPHGQLSAYDFTADTPAPGGLMVALTHLGGVSSIAYAAADIDPVDANTVTLATTPGATAHGALLCARDGSGLGVRASGFIQDYDGAGPYTVTLFEDTAAQCATDAKRLATKTYYPAALNSPGHTIRVCGEHVSQDFRFVGCVPLSLVETREGDRLWWTVEWIAYGGEVRPDSLDGGFKATTTFLPMAPIIGAAGGARYFLNGSSSGTAVPYSSPDIIVEEMRIAFRHHPEKAPPGLQGFKSVTQLTPMITVAIAVPDIDEFKNGTTPSENILVAKYRLRTTHSLSCYHGRDEGKIYSWNLPALKAMSRPEWAFIDNVGHFRAQLATSAYAGDEESGGAGNKAARFGIG